MIDHLLGRPSQSSRKWQVLAVLLFWSWHVSKVKDGPRMLNPLFSQLNKFSPWQLMIATISMVYMVQNIDALLGLSAPEPLAHLYSPNFFRATWINTALDAGFATTMPLRPKWLRDIASIVASLYYIIFARTADEKIRKFSSIGNVEFIRTTADKVFNPYIEFVTSLSKPRVLYRRKVLLPRPSGSPYSRPITTWLYFDGHQSKLRECNQIVLDFPGGGFVAFSPRHHEERICSWANQIGVPILSIDYAKAPEYPYPFAVHEAHDVYRLLDESQGRIVGLGGGKLDILITADSAGANIATSMIFHILEQPSSRRPKLPIAILYAYPALDFNFTSWMDPNHLRTIIDEYSTSDPDVIQQKEHLNRKDALEVADTKPYDSWGKSLNRLFSYGTFTPMTPNADTTSPSIGSTSPSPTNDRKSYFYSPITYEHSDIHEYYIYDDRKLLRNRVLFKEEEEGEDDDNNKKPNNLYSMGDKTPSIDKKNKFATKLTMTSRSSFFNDRVITPSIMRAMAILYIGPRNSPDLSTNYHISPILAPSHLLEQFPPISIICGERDPFIDDTIVFAGRIKEAKRNQLKNGVNLDSLVQTRLVKGWGHGFLMMPTILPEAWKYIDITGEWIQTRLKQAKKDSYKQSLLEEEQVLSFTARSRRRSSSVNKSKNQAFNNFKSQPFERNHSTSSTSSSTFSPTTPLDGSTHSSSSGVNNDNKSLDDIEKDIHQNFLDTDSLLRRRRLQAVIGISSSNE